MRVTRQARSWRLAGDFWQAPGDGARRRGLRPVPWEVPRPGGRRPGGPPGPLPARLPRPPADRGAIPSGAVSSRPPRVGALVAGLFALADRWPVRPAVASGRRDRADRRLVAGIGGRSRRTRLGRRTHLQRLPCSARPDRTGGDALSAPLPHLPPPA